MGTYIELDSIDWKIIRLLQSNGRMTNRELASRVGVAPSTCQLRVRRLGESGVIKGYRAVVDMAALGESVRAFLAVQVRPHRREVVEAFVAHLKTVPEVLEFYHLTGPDDFLIHVAVTDVDRLQALVLDQVTARSEVAHVRTNLVFAQWDMVGR
ncbi:Lrp/AsnC family transcriptional regulator [Haloglycomyces albus]|uniref:Lrp/AsnC family transcriptional regulator n=1 Tax=Haloglycomyces albus TaxID=526067 RepID=UPI00046D1E9C|nr:Lrp/AsnC family transcriptional regulator [Haloglycomyces albus]